MNRLFVHRALIPLLLGICACSDNAVTEPPGVTECDGVATNVLALEPLEGTTLRGDAISCIALAGNGANYLVLPQLTGPSLPYGGYGYRVGHPSANPVALQTHASPPFSTQGFPDDAQRTLDRWLRDAEQELSRQPRVARAAAAIARAGSVAALALDDPREFSVLSSLGSPSTFARVGARLRYAGDHVLVYLDTLSADAFTQSEIDSFGDLYDQSLYGVVRTAFGDGSDIDGNDRIIFLLTPTVNALVGANECAVSGYARGFFFGHDLSSDASTSNRAEIFYGLVPDPQGRWSCAHSRADVMTNLPPTFVHELQHMISFGEHVLERGGLAEEPWLNEGLSHLAEELGSIHYETRFPAPAGRTNPTQIFPDSSGPYITPNLLYSHRFLFQSSQYSITSCAPGSFCSLPERSGTWLFLRWLGDQKGVGIYRTLVQTSLTGVTNLEAAAAEAAGALLGDFAIAVYADSIAGVPRTAVAPRHRFSSRNFRKIYRALYEAYGPQGGVGRPFPIEPRVLTNEGASTGTMRPGTFATYWLSVPRGTAVSLLRFSQVDGTPFVESAGAQLSLFRLPD